MQAEGQVPSQGIRYRSKVDAWLAAVLIGAFLLALMVMLFVLVLSGVFATTWWIAVLYLAIWGGVLSLLFPLYYEITPSTLLVRSGWFRREVPLASIQRVFPTHNPLSAPALSLDRLQVEYTQGSLPRFVLISPRDTASFLRDLAECAGDLEVQGDQLVRR
jgi:membrane protein YdbS with pleckstrin-like domain